MIDHAHPLLMSEGESHYWQWMGSQDIGETPGCCCGHDGMGVEWHTSDCRGAHHVLRKKVLELFNVLAARPQPAGRRGYGVPPDAVIVLHGLYKPQHANAELAWYMSQLRHNGFTLQAIADPLGISRERVRQLIARAAPVVGVPVAPSPPLPPPPPPPLPSPPQLSLEVKDQLKDLQRKATLTRGHTPTNHPNRVASEQLSALLNDLHNHGFSYRQLAEALGIKPFSVRARLAQHGYRGIAPSQRPYRRQVRARPARHTGRTPSTLR